MIKVKNDPTDANAVGPSKIMPPIKTADGVYNEPGLPPPPAGYGRKIGFMEAEGGRGTREEDMGM